MQNLLAFRKNKCLKVGPDTHQPFFEGIVTRCPQCRYVLRTESDKAIHNRLCHLRLGAWAMSTKHD